MIFYIGRFLSWCIYKVMGRLQVIGRERVPKTGGVLLAANHISYVDPPMVGAAAPRPVWFMAKAELFHLPVLGPIMPHVHAFPVKRGTADREALRRAHELLTSGKALTIFPEGTRSPDGKLQPPELGHAMIALRAGVPIVPVAIIDADRMLPPHSALLKFARVKVIFGEPLTFPDLAGKSSNRAAVQEVAKTVMRSIAALMREHGAGDRVPEGYLEEMEHSEAGS